jgi:hypothetical protein
MTAIAESVGSFGVNKPVDVIKIINLINNNDSYTGLEQPLPMSGLVDDSLIGAIKAFQTNHPSIRSARPDGRVDPGGKTLACLDQYHNRAGRRVSYLPKGFDALTFGRFAIDAFIDLYRRQYPVPGLGASAELGLYDIVDRLIADADVTDIRWAAYMLATVKHECANTWMPIEEYGKGAGRDYGQVVSVDGPNNTKLQNTYYGRGFVQLTWDSNYKKMDTALGLSGQGSLYLYPANALDAATAYAVMSYGMRHGSFTGKKLSDYISGAQLDYRGARRIINGHDQAALIAAYAANIEYLLRYCNGS